MAYRVGVLSRGHGTIPLQRDVPGWERPRGRYHSYGFVLLGSENVSTGEANEHQAPTRNIQVSECSGESARGRIDDRIIFWTGTVFSEFG